MFFELPPFPFVINLISNLFVYIYIHPMVYMFAKRTFNFELIASVQKKIYSQLYLWLRA